MGEMSGEISCMMLVCFCFNVTRRALGQTSTPKAFDYSVNRQEGAVGHVGGVLFCAGATVAASSAADSRARYFALAGHLLVCVCVCVCVY